MEKTATKLPEYQNPPLTEVVCGIQFQDLGFLSSVHFGEFWNRIKDEYPQTEDHAPLPDIFEIQQIPPPVPQMRPELSDMPPLRRVFFVTKKGDFLYQFQASRFLSNWRKMQSSDDYPRFSSAFLRFQKGWMELLEFIRSNEQNAPLANQYELTYINHIIEDSDAEAFPVGIRQYLPVFCWTQETVDGFLPNPHTGSARLQYKLPNKSGTLHVSIAHGMRLADKKNLAVLELTARGPASPDWRELTEWFAMAHEWIVRGFTHLTSAKAHQIWGRII